MLDQKTSLQFDKSIQELRTENAQLRIALRQAEELCIVKERKAIEYIFHLTQFKAQIFYRLTSWLAGHFERKKTSASLGNKEAQASHDPYQAWLRIYGPHSETDYEKIKTHLNNFLTKTKFSIILDCRESDPLVIDSSVESVKAQLYSNWEVFLCCKESQLEALQSRFILGNSLSEKIKIFVSREDLAFKDFLLSAMSDVSGDYVAWINAGDRVHAMALYEFAAELDLYPETQILYADEDILDVSGNRSNPCFKPDWNLELFLAQNYVGSFSLLARETFRASCEKLANIQDNQALSFHALTSALRDKVRHVPAVLYHRKLEDQNNFWMARNPQLTQDYLEASGVKGEVVQLKDHPEWVEVRRFSPDPQPKVTIIIPTRNRPDLLRVSLRGVLNETNYKNIEVIIVDHENDHPGVLEIFKSYSNDARVAVLPYRGVFDHSDMNNRAAQIAHGEILLFLNDDIEVIEPDWLTQIVAQFAQKDRGVVGARLLYPDRRIQHAGVILGFGGVAGHGAVGLSADAPGYFGRLKFASEVSALTGACMAMSRKLFEEVGGFSARHLQRTFNDVDLCLKARAKGKINIYTPLATLIHHESATDGGDIKLTQYKRLQGEVGYMLETWGLMRSDPYYNVNLALEGESYSLAFPPRRVAPWEAVGL